MLSRLSANFFRNTTTSLPSGESTRLNASSRVDQPTERNGSGNNNNHSTTYGSVRSEPLNNLRERDDPYLSPGDTSSTDESEPEESFVLIDHREADDDGDDDNDHDDDDDDVVNPRTENGMNSDDIDDTLTSLTRRLRCLFSVVTWPIVPTGSLCILALVWLLYSSFITDIDKSCSHPLHWYSVLSLVFLVYLTFHTSIRSYFFQYDRDRDGPDRPASVRRYDQCFNTVALLYVYAGITIVQTCRDDPLTVDGSAPAGASVDIANTCAATCPNTFSSLRVYIACLELFVLSLVVPLLFLPCLYLYFVRRTMQDAEALSVLQDRLREEEALRRNGGITAEEIMNYFEIVKLVVDPRTIDRKILIVSRPPVARDNEENGQQRQPIDLSSASECDTKECCICMKSFKVSGVSDIETGQIANGENDPAEDYIVRTSRTCSHLFHRRCIASWVGGRWEAGTNAEQRPARHTTCPLCRRDFRPNR